jgi:hypothetical protein
MSGFHRRGCAHRHDGTNEAAAMRRPLSFTRLWNQKGPPYGDPCRFKKI